MAKPKKGSWIVKVRATVEQEWIVDNCTEKEAEDDPKKFVTSQRTLETVDWEVEDVEPNE